ncbi:MAG: organoarsenical effux MFS transporter ArsJ [Arenicella sp.]
MKVFSQLSTQVRQYLLITANYWAFTLTDGALRMLVVLHFHQLGYSPVQIAMLFLFYEIFGVITNLLGGWLGARLGLNKTMNIGLVLQVLALGLLLVPDDMLTVIWVMLAQAISGVAKDLNKMSAKSAIKLLVKDDEQGSLYRWVAFLTGSKNTLKGVGFFLGAMLLALLGFKGAIATMAVTLALVWVCSLLFLSKDMGKAKRKPKFNELFSRNSAINRLSLARLFLFAARDVWFVVALPVFLSSQFGWSHWAVGGFIAMWIIGYGVVQSTAPYLTAGKQNSKTAFLWVLTLSCVPVVIAFGLQQGINPLVSLIGGLFVFGAIFAVNSSLHSYLIVSFARKDGVSLDVGFYYMANAMGRLLGTVLSGWMFQTQGFIACLIVSSVLLGIAAVVTYLIKNTADS